MDHGAATGFGLPACALLPKRGDHSQWSHTVFKELLGGGGDWAQMLLNLELYLVLGIAGFV